MYVFRRFGIAVGGRAIVNYDNHQHSSDENLRLGQFWERHGNVWGAAGGIELVDGVRWIRELENSSQLFAESCQDRLG